MSKVWQRESERKKKEEEKKEEKRKKKEEEKIKKEKKEEKRKKEERKKTDRPRPFKTGIPFKLLEFFHIKRKQMSTAGICMWLYSLLEYNKTTLLQS